MSINEIVNVKKESNTVYALFDFDGTIIRGDSFVDILLYSSGARKFLLRILRNIFYIILFKAKVLSPNKLKTILLLSFFKNITGDRFNNICAEYSLNRIDKLVRPEAINKINWHKENGHKIIIVSASLENWIRPWAEKNGIEDIIATKTEFVNGYFNGTLSTHNCKGKEKVARIIELFPDIYNSVVYAYGDSKGDKQMLALADYPFYRCF